MGNETEPVRIPEDQQLDTISPEVPGVSSRRFGRKKSWILGTGLAGMIALGGGGYWANEHPDKAAEFSRKIIGDENTARLEGAVLSVKDKKDQLKYKYFGGRENPFDKNYTAVTNSQIPEYQIPEPEITAVPSFLPENPYIIIPPDILKPKPLVLPETHILQSSPAEAEGVWVINGLPRTSVADVLMAKTYIRPDSSRPYASVGVLLLDKRRVRLNMIGGTSNPGNGPGRIPEEDLPNLLVTLNGGFQKDHGSWGMYMDGVEYKRLANGYASVVVMKDGTIKMGTWGDEGFTEITEDMAAVRQNAVLLVEKGEVTPLAQNQGSNNDVWGYVNVNSAEFITWRTAIGLTKNGDLMVAAGNSLSANSLARALQAAGAEIAMQLDINTPHVQVSLVFQREGGGRSASFFMETMPGNPERYLGTHNRDFMYITLNETTLKP